MLPKIALIYLSYHSEPYLDRFVESIKKLTYPKERLAIVVVDNPHPVHGSSEKVLRDKLIGLTHARIVPHPAPFSLSAQTADPPAGGKGEGADCASLQTVIFPQSQNLGFAGGNNVGIKWALEHGYDYVYLHNQDGFLAPDALEPLVEVMEADKSIAVAQSLLLLYPETDLLNNAGNSFHYLGFGFCNEYRRPVNEYFSLLSSRAESRHATAGRDGVEGSGEVMVMGNESATKHEGFPNDRSFDCARPAVAGLASLKMTNSIALPIINIPYASGAACMVRAEAIRKWGMLDEDFFMYHEDLEWCFRFRFAGQRIVLVPQSKFYHEYEFSRSMEKYYYMERNRFAVLLLLYKWLTIILILPMFIIMEIGLWYFAWRGGWVDKRRAVYQYWRKRENIRLWLEKRRRIQEMRNIKDRDILKISSPGIYFQEKEVEHPLLKYVANPVMTVYYWMLRTVVWW